MPGRLVKWMETTLGTCLFTHCSFCHLRDINGAAVNGEGEEYIAFELFYRSKEHVALESENGQKVPQEEDGTQTLPPDDDDIGTPPHRRENDIDRVRRGSCTKVRGQYMRQCLSLSFSLSLASPLHLAPSLFIYLCVCVRTPLPFLLGQTAPPVWTNVVALASRFFISFFLLRLVTPEICPFPLSVCIFLGPSVGVGLVSGLLSRRFAFIPSPPVCSDRLPVWFLFFVFYPPISNTVPRRPVVVVCPLCPSGTTSLDFRPLLSSSRFLVGCRPFHSPELHFPLQFIPAQLAPSPQEPCLP